MQTVICCHDVPFQGESFEQITNVRIRSMPYVTSVTNVIRLYVNMQYHIGKMIELRAVEREVCRSLSFSYLFCTGAVGVGDLGCHWQEAKGMTHADLGPTRMAPGSNNREDQ